MNMSLESLLADLEKQAGFDKQAADESEKKDDEKAEGKDKDESKKDEEKSENPFAKAKEELKDAEKDVEKAEQTKEAQAAGAELANQIMQKVASLQISTSNKETEEMNKQASEAGKALADALLEKLANAGDQTTVSGIPEGVAPTKNQIDAAAQVAEQDSVIKPLPTKDAIGNGGGSINQIFDAIVADAMGQGAVTPGELPHVATSAGEGAVVAQGTPNQVATESVEKTAAVMSLVNSGIDFDSAVDMVKAAAEQIEAEEAEQVKQAAFAHLVDSGVDFQLAAALVKSAEQYGYGDAYATGLKANIRGAAEGLGGAAAGGLIGAGIGRLAKATPVGAAIGGVAGLMAGSAHGHLASVKNSLNKAHSEGRNAGLAHQKQAAVSALCNAGVDFDSAVELVQAKSQELYGA